MLGQQIPLEELERRLASADLEISGSEVHGLLAGLLCSGTEDAEIRGIGELLPDLDGGDLLAQECMQLLRRLFAKTRAELDDPDMGFTLMLPDDELPIGQRAAAVVDWCQGFLYGIGIGGVSSAGKLSDQAREALGDISEMTRMDLAGVNADNDDEAALMQVVEFLKVATMLIYEETMQEQKAYP